MSNRYRRELTQEEINEKTYRGFVGGMWDEIGKLQLSFLQIQGLKPDHYLLDVGCGALRGGIQFARYLDTSHYYGIDMNASLIESGYIELKEQDLNEKKSHLLINDKFNVSSFGISFDYAIAQSVFTHLPMNDIIRCLKETSKVMKPDGMFFATFFEAPTTAYLDQITHTRGDITTNYDKDPFHYSFEEFQWMAKITGLSVELIGEWQHPRSQQMLVFSTIKK